jgi:CRISPR/Cas system-associated exonuclease Cas4 (RecB family)
MNFKNLIYQGLQEQDEAGREVYLEDLLRIGCSPRHAFKASGEKGLPQRGPDLLLREVTLRVRRMVSNYLKGCFKTKFRAGRFHYRGVVGLLIDGVLEGKLVEVAVVSTREYNQSRPPRRAVLSAAVKAHVLGLEEALLIQFDRNSQEWSFWNVTGDFSRAAEAVVHDMDYVTRLVAGEGAPIGMASKMTCKRCPYQEVCQLTPQGDPPNYLLREVRATPDPETMAQVDAFLFKKNAEDTGRRTKVLHPSSFSYDRCDREQAYDLLGEEEDHRIDPKLRRIFDVGHCFHDLIQEQLNVMVPNFVEETEVVHEELRIYGHCDGEVGEDGIEIKSINDAGWKKTQSPKTEHKRQATMYGAIRKLKRVHYIYANKETGELKVLPTKLDRSLWHKQATRASNIIKTVEAGELPPPIDSDYTCRKCKYAWTCKPQRRTQPKRTFR